MFIPSVAAQDDEAPHSPDIGQELYQANCASCHGDYSSGAVSGNVIGAALDNNAYIQASDDTTLLEFLNIGRAADHPDNVSGIVMPAKGGNANLNDDDLLSIIAYLRTLDNGAESTVNLGDDSAALEIIEIPNEAYQAYDWELVVDNLDNPINVVAPNDDTERLFAVEQTGFILVVENGAFDPIPFLDLSTAVPTAVYSGGYSEQGLLGLAFHPDYAENGQLFVSYINVEGNSVISRFEVMTDNPNQADPQSEQILLTVDQPFEDHNGGHLAFGGDGYLYIGFGDGGRPAEPNYFSQDPTLYLGKMLRIDVNAETYTIPDDNPFLDDPDFPPEVWALGLRNPWRFSFDRATGDLYIGDVGQWLIEEINFQAADSGGGQNYGWSLYEGTDIYLDDADLAGGDLTDPILTYTHDEGCSVTGGYVYRGDELPDLVSKYLYGDYCGGRIWIAERDADGEWTSEVFMDTPFVISSFGEDADGELYLVDYKGAIYRLVSDSPF